MDFSEAKISKVLSKETSNNILKWASEYSKMTIELFSESQELSFSYKNLFEPFSWELIISFDDLKNIDKKWSRFHDLEELFYVLYTYNQKGALKVTREDDGIMVSFETKFIEWDIVFDFFLKPDDKKKDLKSLMADFGKIMYEQQVDLKEVKKKYDELERTVIQEKVDLVKEINEHIEKSQNLIDKDILGKVPEVIDDKLKIVFESMNKAKEDVQSLMKACGDQKKLIKDANEKNESKLEEQQRTLKDFMVKVEEKHQELEESITTLVAKDKQEKPEFIKMTFHPGSFSGTATGWTNLGNTQTLAIKEKKTLKWTLELKGLYSNTNSFFTRLRIYITGPENIYFPGDSNGFLHEWGATSYGQANNKRETGVLELASSGIYTARLQYYNSSGNYLYVKDPTLYLEVFTQKRNITKLQFYSGQLTATNTSMANMGNAVTFIVPKAKSSYQWILELKAVYSNTYNFYHKVNLYFTGPQSFHIPDAGQTGFLHEWFSPGYSNAGNVRETGFMEFEKEGTYTIYLQMQSSSGNCFYFNDPTLYLLRMDNNEFIEN